jgi:hypothetical protein
MRKREQITRMDYAFVVDGKFIQNVDNQNLKILYHFIFKKYIIGNKENFFISITTKYILEFTYININKEYTVINRTFNFLCTHFHLTIISQNFIESK